MVWSRKLRRSCVLNGSHGEWTESDDVKTGASGAVARIKRKEKEARKKLQAVEGCGDEDLPIPEIHLIVVYHSVNTDAPLYAVGENEALICPIFKDGEWNFTDHTGKQYHNPRRAGAIERCKQVSPGYYITDADAEPLTLVCPFELYEFKDKQTGILQLHRELVYKPMKSELEKSFPGASVTTKTLDSFAAKGNQRYSQLPVVIRAGTIRYFVEHLRAQRSVIMSNHRIRSVLQAKENLKPPHEREYVPTPKDLDVDTYVSLGIDPQYARITNDPAVDVPFEEASDNLGFVVVKSKGYALDQGHSLKGTFTTRRAPGVVRWYSTQFCSFRTHVAGLHFITHDNSPTTAEGALSRMFKARPDETFLRQCQLVATDIDVPGHIAEHVSNKPFGAAVAEAHGAVKERFREDPQATHLMERINQRVRMRYGSGLSHPGVVAVWPTFLQVATSALCTVPLVYLYLSLHMLTAFSSAIYNLDDTRFGFAMMASKRRLYLQYYHKVFWWHTEFDDVVPAPEAKVKFETGKAGRVPKPGRLFVTYDSDIIYHGWVWKYIKAAVCRDWSDPTYHKSQHTIYERLMNDVWSPTTIGLHTRSFSDDLEGVLNRPHKPPMRFVWDISTCDATNGPGNFAIIGVMLASLGSLGVFRMFMAALRATITLFNPDNRAEYVCFRPTTIFMGSGHGCTTTANNIYQSVNVMAFQAVVELASTVGYSHHGGECRHLDDMSDEQIVEMLHFAASLNGCIGSLKVCPNLQDSDFLKNFICHTTCGARTPALALGAILRNFGKTRGDVDATVLGISTSEFSNLEPAEVMERFLSGVVRGLCNEPGNIILNALRRRFSVDCRVQEERYWSTVNRSNFEIPLEELQTRYGCSDFEWVTLAKEIESMVLGAVISSPVITAIFAKDYSLE